MDIARTLGSPKAEMWLQSQSMGEARKNKPPLPSLLLTNARSIVNKMDELRLQLEDKRLIMDCCALIITKYPEAAHTIMGDFNHVDLKIVFPKFHQQVNGTRSLNTEEGGLVSEDS